MEDKLERLRTLLGQARQDYPGELLAMELGDAQGHLLAEVERTQGALTWLRGVVICRVEEDDFVRIGPHAWQLPPAWRLPTSPPSSAEVEQAMAAHYLAEREQNAHPDRLAPLQAAWVRTVEQVEAGYRLDFSNYVNHLLGRSWLQELQERLPPTERARVAAWLGPLDARFAAATRRIPTSFRHDPYRPWDRYWWWQRVPRQLVGDLLYDLACQQQLGGDDRGLDPRLAAEVVARGAP